MQHYLLRNSIENAFRSTDAVPCYFRWLVGFPAVFTLTHGWMGALYPRRYVVHCTPSCIVYNMCFSIVSIIRTYYVVVVGCLVHQCAVSVCNSDMCCPVCSSSAATKEENNCSGIYSRFSRCWSYLVVFYFQCKQA